MKVEVEKTIRLKAEKDYPRIDLFLKETLKNISRSKIERSLASGRVKRDHKIVEKKSERVRRGDTVEIVYVEHREDKGYIPTLKLQKLYEDPYLLIIDKPAGIAVHPGAGKSEETILDIFTFYYPQVEQIKDTPRPGIVHRLDRETSGILILAKNETVMRRMQKKFKRREVKKTYTALVEGHLRYRHGTIDAPITRSLRDRKKFTVPRDEENRKARQAITDFSVLYQFPDFSLVRLFPQTGRTHQLRVHLRWQGNPILGDRLYGKKAGFSRLALHASDIRFLHPISANLVSCHSPLPETFRRHLQNRLKEIEK